MGSLSGADVGMASAAGAVVVFAIAYALMRSDRRDPLERLGAWASDQGLGYVAPESDASLASFTGEVDGFRIEVSVRRVGRSFGNDLPTRVTSVAVARVAVCVAEPEPGAAGVAARASETRVCTVQPAAWVLDTQGRAVGDSVPSGDEAFDAEWSARGADVDAVRGVLTSALRERLLHADARGLVIEIATDSITIPMPGLCADAHELDRRLALAVTLAHHLLDD